MANIIRYRLRTDTAANWSAGDPVLLSGEPGFDSTAGRLKWGDGVTAWSSLPYVGPQVVDDLTTGGTDKVLSAEQGKVLKELVDAAAVTGGGYQIASKVFAGSIIRTSFTFQEGVQNTFKVPDGVQFILVSGCGGGGGCDVGADGRVFSGWSAGYCLDCVLRVIPGEVLKIVTGGGGVGRTIASTIKGRRGGHSSIFLSDGTEILHLGGGNAPNDRTTDTTDDDVLTANGHSGNQTGEAWGDTNRLISGRFYPPISYRAAQPPDYVSDDIKKLFSGAISPATPFGEFGRGGVLFGSTERDKNGGSGTVILKYVIPA